MLPQDYTSSSIMIYAHHCEIDNSYIASTLSSQKGLDISRRMLVSL